MGWKAALPRYSVLQTERVPMMGSLERAIELYFEHWSSSQLQVMSSSDAATQQSLSGSEVL